MDNGVKDEIDFKDKNNKIIIKSVEDIIKRAQKSSIKCAKVENIEENKIEKEIEIVENEGMF